MKEKSNPLKAISKRRYNESYGCSNQGNYKHSDLPRSVEIWSGRDQAADIDVAEICVINTKINEETWR